MKTGGKWALSLFVVLLVLALAGVAFWFWWKRRKTRKELFAASKSGEKEEN